MWYLFFQIWLWLIAAFVLGWLSHWFFCCRNKEQSTVSNFDKPVSNSAGSAAIGANETALEAKPSIAEPSVARHAPAESSIPTQDRWKPKGFTNRPDQVDDLKRIKGVGAVLENTLNELGIYQFKQITEWDSDNISWVDNFLSFAGRIKREDWIAQARTLASGGTTEFSSRVDKGDVDY